ncbi:hypothetical protein Efla_002962 [Eimeria flavescens]
MEARGPPSGPPGGCEGPLGASLGLTRRTHKQQQLQQQQQEQQQLLPLVYRHPKTTNACSGKRPFRFKKFISCLGPLLPHRLLLRGQKHHRNVSLMMYFRVLNAISYAARSAAIFDAYLHMQFGGNKAIGAMASLTGLITVIVAPLAGWSADALKARRCVALKAAAVWGLLCVGVNYAAIELSSFNLLLTSNLMWKAWYESVTVFTESLFNDAIPPGQRSHLFVLRRILTTLANGLGPLLSLCVFLSSENSWRADVLHRVLKVGVFLSIPQLVVLLFWREITEEEALSIRMQGSSSSSSSSSSNSSSGGPAAADPHQHQQQQQQEEEGDSVQLFFLKTQHVPWLIFVSHCITFCGAGKPQTLYASPYTRMTVKYFPLFFKSEYAFKPIHSCLLSTAYTLSIATLTYVIQFFAARMGPVKASFLFTSIGVCGLFLLSQVYWLPAVVVIYLLRGAFQNASTPLDRSVCLDLIPSRLVGRWAALQSLATLMWSVSALCGGFLADYTDYRQIFTFTGRVYIVAQLVYAPCLWLLPPPRSSSLKQQQQLDFSKQPVAGPTLTPTTTS